MPVGRLETINPEDFRNGICRIWLTSNNVAEVDAAIERLSLAPSLRNNPDQIAALLTQVMQFLCDTRQLLSDLPVDDPDKTIDPALGERLFHQNIGGQDYLVSRSIIVLVTWDGTKYIISCRQARN